MHQSALAAVQTWRQIRMKPKHHINDLLRKPGGSKNLGNNPRIVNSSEFSLRCPQYAAPLERISEVFNEWTQRRLGNRRRFFGPRAANIRESRKFER
jgi:hypothetical protein